MSSDLEDPFPSLFRQLFPFLIGLLDDALIVGLSRLGCHIPWLESLSPIVMSCTALYLAVQFWHHGVPKLVDLWWKFRSSFGFRSQAIINRQLYMWCRSQK